MALKITTTPTFDRGMKDALKRESHGIPELEVIAEIVNSGLRLSAGRRLEKLYERIGGPVYSVRIDQGYRLTFQIIGDTVRFRAVGNHDDCYNKDSRQS